MKPIKLTEENREQVFSALVKNFVMEADNFAFNSKNGSITIKTGLEKKLDEKITILFSQKAYTRMKALVKHFTTEVGWYGLVEKKDARLYYVYDVLVCKQTVNGSKVDTEEEDTIEFFESLTDDQANHMHFQAHSHVNMGTSASAIDLQNQYDVIHNMGDEGFYIFQIWNKRDEVSTYMFDVSENTFYDSNDVNLEVEDDEGTVTDYLKSIEGLITEKKFEYKGQGYNWHNDWNKQDWKNYGSTWDKDKKDTDVKAGSALPAKNPIYTSDYYGDY